MPTLEQQEKFLEVCVRDYDYILIDTCSLMSPGAHAFWQHIVPITRRYGMKIVVPFTVVNELKQNSKNASKDLASRKAAHDALVEVSHLWKAGDIQIPATEEERNALAHPEAGGKEKAFADAVILTALDHLRMKYDTLTITQDRGLTADILARGRSTAAVRVSKNVHVRALTKDGYLRLANRSDGGGPSRPGQPQGRTGAPSYGTGIPFAKDVTTLQQYPGKMELHLRPETGAAVTARYGDDHSMELRLGKELGHGGEGGVYRTDQPGLVAKIYNAGKLTCMKYEKLKRMVAHNIECRGVCFPKALIYNAQGEFCGYLMDEAKGMTLDDSVFRLWKKGPENPLPTWTKRETVQLCITILEKIVFLHSMNIILGDINEMNILVVSPTEVYFVDTDSYQVEGFPCPVGQEYFTARELWLREGKLDYHTFLRTMGNENFAIATLLFMIMVPGKSPYSMIDGMKAQDNIIRGDFPYPFGEKSTGKVPEGRWRYCWSQLPYHTKEKFYETFRRGEAHSTEDTRYSAEDWLDNFKGYRKLLNRLEENDDEALAIFPTHFKRQAGVTYEKCKLCGREFDERSLASGNGYCYKCRRETYRTFICCDCGKSFAFTYGEKGYFEANDMEPPKRCPECRKARKEGRQHPHSTRQQSTWQQSSVLRPLPKTRPTPKPAPAPRPTPKPAPEPAPKPQPRVDPPQEPAKPQGVWDFFYQIFR